MYTLHRLSENFVNTEFACRCGCGFGSNPNDVNPKLIILLEKIRAHFDAPVTIVSGCRCPKHNSRVGGASSSQHKLGNAADIKVQGVTASVVADWVSNQYPNGYGVGKYVSFTHVDVRAHKARWGW